MQFIKISPFLNYRKDFFLRKSESKLVSYNLQLHYLQVYFKLHGINLFDFTFNNITYNHPAK